MTERRVMVRTEIVRRPPAECGIKEGDCVHVDENGFPWSEAEFREMQRSAVVALNISRAVADAIHMPMKCMGVYRGPLRILGMPIPGKGVVEVVELAG